MRELVSIGRVTVSTATLRRHLARFLYGDGAWPRSYGPAPGAPGCQVPARFLGDAPEPSPPAIGATVIPFPASRRLHQVRKTANYIATASPGVAESHMRVQLERLEAGLTRKGVAPDLVAAEVGAYRAALQAEIWRAVLLPGGAA